MIDSSGFMAGPRGRRLCLEVAASLARATASPEGEDYLRAAFFSAHHLDPGAGTSRVMLRAGAGGRQEAEPTPTPADVARHLDAVPLRGLDTGVLLVALKAAVDSARYWQEPDGEDVLAATPHVRGALSRVATHIASSGPPAWWSAPIERTTQACVVFADPAAPTKPSAQGADQVLSRWRHRTLEEESTAQLERPADPRAAVSGTWWSTPPRELTRTTRSIGPYGPVGLHLVEDAVDWDQALVRSVLVPTEATVYEVDGPDAWSLLCRRFPLEVTASRRHDWFRTTGVAERWVVPDWARVAAHVDAVHVTTAGYLSTAGRAVAVEPGTSSVLAGWNPDETFWLTDPPPAPEADRRWHRVDDDTWQVDPR